MPDAFSTEDWDRQPITLAAGVSKGELWQLGNGHAAFIPDAAHNSGEQTDFQTSGLCTVTKANGVKFLDGGRVYWDHSANNATYKPVNDRDFYIGTAFGDWEAGDLTMQVNLNAEQRNLIDFNRDAFDTIVVGTQVTGTAGLSEPKIRGGARKFLITATNEAQKIDMISQFAFAKTANAIIEGIANVRDDGSGTVVDVSMGVANATNATNADDITESVFVHLDANDVNIYAESDDGTTEVAATDTTIDYTAATPFEFWIDMRNPADVQIYINAALVLGATTFNVDAATGPFKLLLHIEKSASTDTYELDVNRFVARLMEQ
jgi:predicted RecA/RadA family phage recombinase